MITYLATDAHTYTIERYLEAGGQPLAGRFRIESYQSLLRNPDFEVHPGTYIFSDIERLVPVAAQSMGRAWRRISDLGGEVRILNHPTHSMRRYELLRTLFDLGVNTFDVYRLAGGRRPRRWPVFIRQENRHTKNLTPLLHTPKELEAAAANLFEQRYSREDKLVIEFCDTRGDDGLFYAYSALLIGERVIPRNLFMSHDWVVYSKNQETTPSASEMERRYIETNPHERQLREIFRRARIEYGKIDYAMLGDRLQIWEINTNPNLLSGVDRPALACMDPADAERKVMISQVAKQIDAAFAEIDATGVGEGARPPA